MKKERGGRLRNRPKLLGALSIKASTVLKNTQVSWALHRGEKKAWLGYSENNTCQHS